MQQRKELRQAGLKVTLPRLKILEILEDSKLRHMSAEIEKIQHQIAEKHGFELLDHSLVLYVKAKENSGDD